MDVGERLKTLRKLKKLSQRELAKRAGVTNSMVSMIENNGVSPSVSSLKKVLSGLPVSIGDFFTMEPEEISLDQTVVYRADEQPDIGSKDVRLFLIGGKVRDRTMDILHEVYPPGGDTGEEMLQHDGEEGGVVIQGTIELTVGFDVYVLHAGDGYFFKSNQPHRFRNISDEPCEIISANPSV